MTTRKRLKGIPVIRGEVKERHNIMLTMTAWQLLKSKAGSMNTSVSEIIEMLARSESI